MNGTKYLIIPDREHIADSLALAEEYGTGFEFNDFFNPEMLESPTETDRLIDFYLSQPLPGFNTLHGAFFDITVFSYDRRIRQVSDLRIRQSLEIARRLGVKAVIFHSNINPQISSFAYTENWLRSNREYWSGILEEYGDVDIYIENMFDDSPIYLEKLSAELSGYSNYGVCFDYAHGELSGTSANEWAWSLSTYTKHMHINDNDLKDDLHLPIGDGKIDWERFRRIKEEYFINATVLIETPKVSGQRKSLERLVRMENNNFGSEASL